MIVCSNISSLLDRDVLDDPSRHETRCHFNYFGGINYGNVGG